MAKQPIPIPRKKIRNFTDLYAWQEGHTLVKDVYKITKTFPQEERFGLANQLSRAVVSVTSNIAEGFGRTSHREKAQFYSMAIGSLAETQNQIIIARDVNYISPAKALDLLKKSELVSKLINGLIKKSRSASSDS